MKKINLEYPKQVESMIDQILALSLSFKIKEQGDEKYLFFDSHGLGFPKNDPKEGEQRPISYYKGYDKLLSFLNDIVMPVLFLRGPFRQKLLEDVINMVQKNDEELADLLESKI